MKIIIAPDSFKGSMTAFEAATAIERGVKKAFSKADTIVVPVADGGEGTMDSLVTATNGRKIETVVKGPLMEDIKSSYGILGDEQTCVIEMASASGLNLVEPDKRNPLWTTSYGTGELIKNALDDGCRKFILAIGGSATNDGGIGMLQALGMKLLDSNGNSIRYGGVGLSQITEIDHQDFDARIANCEFIIASDVQNPLVGINGATHVFGPQKGATPEMLQFLDYHLTKWADLVESKTGIRLHERPGAGAAGGIGGAFQAFFPSTTQRGIDLVIKYTGLKEKLDGAQCVFTGEGQIDYQTASGKTPMGVAQIAKQKRIPVFALAGSIGNGIDELYQYGITSVHSIVQSPMGLKEAMERGPELLEATAEQVIRTFFA
ncbi:glycerate kinase [Bacillus sp. FJAT-49736]|uniref:glycerate kinase family protein n=1 Tax=Bacillus sp. FJAT-49736 TaxID=2833582 RepID=UPI001BC8D5BA|nr:glycerate kinase [Bacillus sp. FJAT-49736]MBS4174841.1 glycerate kinase [Bacillus sp. FJAT-49736]